MIVYIDLIIISTVITDYAILKIIKEVWKEKIKIYRLILSLLVSIINIFLFIFPFKHLIILRYFSGILIPTICFKYKTLKDMIIKIVTYYILNIFYIGTIIVFNITSFMMLLLALLFVVVSYLIESYRYITINENKYIYKVVIEQDIYNAYLDTGNMMYYDGIPVVIICNKYFNSNIYKYISYMKVSSVGNNSLIDIYSGPPIKVDNNEYIVYYTFNNINYDIILHKDIR